MSCNSLAGKTALVTGASRNIGRAIALKLAGAGANIVVNTLSDRTAAEAVAREIESLDARASFKWPISSTERRLTGW